MKYKNVYEKEFIEFMREKGVFTKSFEDYIKDKVKVVDYELFNGYWGCFPKVDNGILVDIRVIVPYIIDKKTLLINIHEYMHAKRLYSRLGKRYSENINREEKVASNMEKVYLKNSSV